MIERHYGRSNVVAEEFDELISEAEGRAETSRVSRLQTRNLPGTFEVDETRSANSKRETPDESGVRVERATGVEPATSSLGS